MFSGCSGATEDNIKTASTLKQGTNITLLNATTPKFAIYLVKSPNNVGLDSKDIDKFVLQTEPVITEEDIASCNWNDTNIRLGPEYKNKSSFTLKDGDAVWGRIRGSGIYPFVAMVNNVRTYVGEFVFPATSMATGRYIYVYSPIPTSEQEKNTVQLFGRSDKDFIHDARIYDAFKSCGIPFLNK